jgi:hypothetical protein
MTGKRHDENVSDREQQLDIREIYGPVGDFDFFAQNEFGERVPTMEKERGEGSKQTDRGRGTQKNQTRQGNLAGLTILVG